MACPFIFFGEAIFKSMDSSDPPQGLSLSNLSGTVLRAFASQPDMTFREAADRVIEGLPQNPASSEDSSAIHDKIYDILHVLVAAGLLAPVGGSNRYRSAKSNRADPQEAQRLSAVTAQKRQTLITHLLMLTRYRALISRNESQVRPTAAMQLPAIVVGFNASAESHSRLSSDRRTLRIEGTASPSFFSPVEVLSRAHLPVEPQREIFRNVPELVPFEVEVIGDQEGR
jgi:hypothetical protein